MVTPLERLMRQHGTKPGFLATILDVTTARIRSLRNGDLSMRASEALLLGTFFKVPVEDVIHVPKKKPRAVRTHTVRGRIKPGPMKAPRAPVKKSSSKKAVEAEAPV